jgi:FdhD protein
VNPEIPEPAGIDRPIRSVKVLRVGPDTTSSADDEAAAEEPLQIQLGEEPFAVIMRTPGTDADLVAGFLFSERVIDDGSALVSIESPLGPKGLPQHNVQRVTLQGVDVEARLKEQRRVVMNASCGLCGRQTLASLLITKPPIVSDWQIDAAVLRAIPERCRRQQAAFERTGGLHAAALCSSDGTIERLAEDVGRHNAVDKVIGGMLRAGRLPLDSHFLFVSGRTSYEIIQKAFLAGIPIVAAVSAPSTLAVDLAEQAGMTLVGFARGERFNVYTHAERIAIEDR